jgi:predicted NBD/HSP70 family sugar kinase
MTVDLPSLGIGVDIGGTSTKAAVVDGQGEVKASISIPTVRGPDGVVATAVKATLTVARCASISTGDVEAIGFGIPGVVDPHRGTVRYAVNVGLDDTEFELAARLAEELGVAVHMENDVRAAAFGADWVIATTDRPVDDLAYLSIGTGIAAGYVEHGRVRRGSSFVAGEIGHIPIDSRGPRCVCGQIGCIEAIASGSAIERLWPTVDGSPVVDLHHAATHGNGPAHELWSSVIGGLSRAVLLLALTWDPEVIVLSGGVSALGDVLRDEITTRLRHDATRSGFLDSLDLGTRLRVIEPSVPLGPIGAIRAAHAATVGNPVWSP